MRIATYNMLFGGKGKCHWSRVMTDYDPEIFLVQETYPPHEHVPNETLRQHAAWCAVAGQSWGSSVYIKSSVPQAIAVPDFTGWVVGAEVSGWTWPGTQETRLRVFSLHAPTRNISARRAVNAILDMIKGLKDGCDLVIGGDFNLTISERPGYDPVKTQAADLAIQARLRDEFDLVNCWQNANPGLPLAQTLRWQSDPETPYHCDGIFVPKRWAERLRSCRVVSGGDWDQLSDHNPVVVEFD